MSSSPENGPATRTPASSRLFADYGMIGVLVLLCVCCALGTIQKRTPTGREAAWIVAEQIGRSEGGRSEGGQSRIVIFAGDTEFADELERILAERKIDVLQKITGKTPAMRKSLEQLIDAGQRIDVIATAKIEKLMIADVREGSPALREARVLFAGSYWRSIFLSKSNLLSVANKNVVIAVIAVGMTMVIITGGIDLSVGSLVALSAVLAAVMIGWVGGKHATTAEMLLCSLGAVAICACVGGFSGTMVTIFKIPPFVVTLAMMWVASGMAFIIAGGETISELPKSYNWLGMGNLASIPNTLILMVIIYVIGHVIMSRTTFGRHIYAIGGNRLAARLSGIRVNRVLLLVYTISGAMAGVGGVMLASQFTAGAPRYGRMYELHAIAAVVVGGTSLAGGEGKILGTLIGVLIIAVVQTAMNLLEIGSHQQNVVLGMIVLLVVLLDSLKRRGWRQLLSPE